MPPKEGVKDYRSTTRDCRRIIDEFNEEGIDGMIMDLSTNGGGSLTEAIDLTGLFIDLGTVVQVKDPSGRVQQYDDRNKGTSYDGPLVVLCSKFSASASEIFAGALSITAAASLSETRPHTVKVPCKTSWNWEPNSLASITHPAREP